MFLKVKVCVISLLVTTCFNSILFKSHLQTAVFCFRVIVCLDLNLATLSSTSTEFFYYVFVVFLCYGLGAHIHIFPLRYNSSRFQSKKDKISPV